MRKLALLLGIAASFAALGFAARWLAAEMHWDFTITYLVLLTLVSGLLSLMLALQRSRLRRQLRQLPAQEVEALAAMSDDIRYALPTPGSRSSFLTVSVGIAAVNLPTLPLLVGPVFVLQTWFTAEPPWPQFAALGFGLALAWAWWSVAVTWWRRWAEAGGMTGAEVQHHGEKASILWPRGHFFERTEWANLRPGRRPP